MKILQVNSVISSGSTGRIVEDMNNYINIHGGTGLVGCGRKSAKSSASVIRIGNTIDFGLHVFKTRLFDRHAFGSVQATRRFVKVIDEINPDIIHLHNIHGYYLNIKVFFEYLKERGHRIIWTLHDCWPFTGHCCYFDTPGCYKWQSECNSCPVVEGYPKSFFIDRSRSNFYDKKLLFSDIDKMIIVTPSIWLLNHLKNSFLQKYESVRIYNGVNLDLFKPDDQSGPDLRSLTGKRYILGVANIWSERKGLKDFIRLRAILNSDIDILLIGTTDNQKKSTPPGIICISRTDNLQELISYYSNAVALVNPTYVDNFPTVNIEALACGTPVITYDTGGSPEAVDPNTGIVVARGNIGGLKDAIEKIISTKDKFTHEQCRIRAENNFSSLIRLHDYMDLYKKLLA